MERSLHLRLDFHSVELRKLARHCGHHRLSCRLPAIAAAYDGMSRADAARVGGMSRQTPRDWVMRFNEEGADGLKHRFKGKPRRKLTDGQLRQLANLVEAGPDLARDGVVGWRRIDLQQLIKERFGVTYHKRTICKLLDVLGFSKSSSRPPHPEQDERVIQAFKETFPPRLRPR